MALHDPDKDKNVMQLQVLEAPSLAQVCPEPEYPVEDVPGRPWFLEPFSTAHEILRPARGDETIFERDMMRQRWESQYPLRYFRHSYRM